MDPQSRHDLDVGHSKRQLLDPQVISISALHESSPEQVIVRSEAELAWMIVLEEHAAVPSHII